LQKKIAIVIPAYKGKFLSFTLQSLVAQTSLNFRVYIGDDNSPDNLLPIIESFNGKLDITFKRFAENVGRADLVAHWQRCIQLTGNEEWIWILPDDDVASPDCIESFLKGLDDDKLSERLYRFQTVHIDEQGEVVKELSECPPTESNVDFIVRKLRFERSSSIAEYIFSRKQYQGAGGLTSLPLGWGSDDLLWVALTQQHDIITLPAGKVALRQSSFNISNNRSDYTDQKFNAKYLFLKYLLDNETFIDKVTKQLSMEKFRKEIATHLFFEYRSYNIRFTPMKVVRYAAKNSSIIGGGFLKNIYRIIRYQLTT
jgi:glycosyltransferase involved in cell wall biosynthesis